MATAPEAAGVPPDPNALPPSPDVNDTIRRAMSRLLNHHGKALCGEPARFGQQLGAALPQYPAALAVLGQALTVLLGQGALRKLGRKPWRAVGAKACLELATAGLPEPVVTWALNTWGVVLGEINGDLPGYLTDGPAPPIPTVPSNAPRWEPPPQALLPLPTRRSSGLGGPLPMLMAAVILAAIVGLLGLIGLAARQRDRDAPAAGAPPPGGAPGGDGHWLPVAVGLGVAVAVIGLFFLTRRPAQAGGPPQTSRASGWAAMLVAGLAAGGLVVALTLALPGGAPPPQAGPAPAARPQAPKPAPEPPRGNFVLTVHNKTPWPVAVTIIDKAEHTHSSLELGPGAERRANVPAGEYQILGATSAGRGYRHEGRAIVTRPTLVTVMPGESTPGKPSFFFRVE
jgi:hypothetical protein